MRAVVQRVVRAAVKVDGAEIANKEHGYAVLVSVSTDATDADSKTLAEKIAHLRIFDDEQGKLNRSILDVRGAVLSVSQFTLYGDTSGGRRPSFVKAAPPQQDEALYEVFSHQLRSPGGPLETVQFRAVRRVHTQDHRQITV